MAYRFNDSEKWKKEWYQNLPPTLKCVWEYLRDNCDCAGVWSINLSLLNFQVKDPIEVTLPKILQAFGTRIEQIAADKLLIVDFIPFQYGKLSRACKPHNQVFDRLEELNLLDRYTKGIHTLKEKEQVKEKDLKGGVGEKLPTAPVKAPPDFDFEKAFVKYPSGGGPTPTEDCRREITTSKLYEDLEAAIDAYIAEGETKQWFPQYTKLKKNFMREWKDWAAKAKASPPKQKRDPVQETKNLFAGWDRDAELVASEIPTEAKAAINKLLGRQA